MVWKQRKKNSGRECERRRAYAYGYLKCSLWLDLHIEMLRWMVARDTDWHSAAFWVRCVIIHELIPRTNGKIYFRVRHRRRRCEMQKNPAEHSSSFVVTKSSTKAQWLQTAPKGIRHWASCNLECGFPILTLTTIDFFGSFRSTPKMMRLRGCRRAFFFFAFSAMTTSSNEPHFIQSRRKNVIRRL